MKRIAILALLAASAVTTSFGQATSKAVGFVTLNLQTGNNFVGFSLQPSTAFTGAFTVSPTDRTHIFLSNTTITDDLFNGANGTHVIEITTAGANQGTNTQVVDTIGTGSEVILQDALPAGVADGSSITIWKLRTLGDAFGATNSAGLTAGSSSTADLIMIPNGSGYDQYFYSSGGIIGAGWRKVGASPANTNQVNVPLYYTDGFLIQARSSKSVTITGEVKTGKTQLVLETGNNFVVNLCPVNAGGTTPSSEGRTLGNSGLYNATAQGLTAGTSNTADLVLIWNGTGYDQYFYSSGGIIGSGWRLIGASPANSDKSSTALPDGAYIVLRRGAPTTIQLAQGTF